MCISNPSRVICAALVAGAAVCAATSVAATVSVADYPSIQDAVDANPGVMLAVPPGDYAVAQKVRISGTGGGLYGYGRIIQANPDEPVLEIEHAGDARIVDITLTRAEGAQEATAPGILCWDDRNVTIEGVRVLDNHAREAAIEVRECRDVTVRDCEVRNYKRIAIDDRTASDLYGYAFRCIDGTGILVNRSIGTRITGNRIVEHDLLPTREVKEANRLGEITVRPSERRTLMPQSAWDTNYVSNWHQGSAIIVTAPRDTRHTQIADNYIENAAQGVDIHSDFVTCANNTVNHGMMGIKATHGSRNLIISNNMLTHIDLWGILVNPGAASGDAAAATETTPAQEANVDRGIIISNNIITDYGYGHEYWNWGGATNDQGGSYAIALLSMQLPTNPPLADILVQGNIVYDAGRDSVLVDGQPQVVPPRYRYAVRVESWQDPQTGEERYPEGLHFVNNILHPGTGGVSNIELQP